MSLRLVITAALFIDVYFNVQNDRFDFTLIDSGKRIFGYDNLKSWPCHPYSNPEEHVECGRHSLCEIMQETASVIIAPTEASLMAPDAAKSLMAVDEGERQAISLAISAGSEALLLLKRSISRL